MGRGKEGNKTRESHDWSDYFDVEQPGRQLSAYEEAPPRHRTAPTHLGRTPRHGLRTFGKVCRQWQSIPEPIVKIVFL